MGSPCDIRLYVEHAAQAARAVAAACEEINRLEEKYSRFKHGNLFYQVNQAAAAGSDIIVDDEFASLLNFADTCYQQSNGLFDVTSGVLRKAWKFTMEALETQDLPSDSDLQQLRNQMGWQYVRCTQIAEHQHRVSFARAGMELDFGGIVKEYAVDRAAAICAEHGIQHGMVDMGGDIHVIGPHPEGDPWTVHIRHPRVANEHFATIKLYQGGLASSGDYERCVMIAGERYCHILSPHTAHPVRGMASVSVVAPQCVLAGSACTIAMLKEFAAPEWLEQLQLPHVWADVNGKIGGLDKNNAVSWTQGT